MTEAIKTICVVGLGYVGLPLAVELSKHFNVIGFDVNEERVATLNNGSDENSNIDSSLLKSENIIFTSNPQQIAQAQFIIACVPTPIDEQNKPDLFCLTSVSQTIGEHMSTGSIVVYESTVYPGVTEDVCVPLLEKYSGMKCKDGFKVGYSPERINPGDKEHTLNKVTKIVSGIDEESLSAIDYVYSRITTTHKASSIKVAEGAKVIENIQRDLNIALMNELAMIFDRMNIDVYDVLEAAGTKWNFHKYHPGLVGGHCFDKKTLIFVKDKKGVRIEEIGRFVDSLHCPSEQAQETTLFYPDDVQVWSYDVDKNTASFQPVSIASKRTDSNGLCIRGPYHYDLTVTERHPVVVYDKGFKIKLAKDLSLGDKLVLSKVLPTRKKIPLIDMLQYLPRSLYPKIRVKLAGKKISDFRAIINSSLSGKKGNYYAWDYLPLEKFLKVEKKIGISRRNIYLCTGRGPGLKKFPCIFQFDKEMARLLGYYLSEGCITDDRTLRTRFTFHRQEKEYLDDVQAILKRRGIDFSIYQDKTYQATVIKVSSLLFGFLLRNVLCCGKDCYTMQIPWQFMETNVSIKEELLKGMFRGDGGVTIYSGARTYSKKGKEFTHDNTSICISFFSSSKTLFQQAVLLLLHLNILPKLAKRPGYLTISGPKDVSRLQHWFLGDKKKKVEKYLCERKRDVVYPYAKHLRKIITLDIQAIERRMTDVVYSLEVPATKTLITTNGIVAHNCIGVDPYYLTHKAEELGYKPEVILAGRKINDNMHKHYSSKILQILESTAEKNQKKKVVLLGLTFKPNVNDFRNSRVKHLIKDLQQQGVDVFAYDPFLSKDIVEKHFGAKYLDPYQDKIDAQLIVKTTEHDKLKNWSKDFGREVLTFKNL
ncbi:MAG TPA: nucleotide sugar dehydrogenase [Candidatus Nanoarchaeia archaeon]|nr:nucleotide sugar dehydrogenase [Candidatus Nanoarchaeia archaeon]